MQENYIVRIFRRNEPEPGQAVGTVECVESSERIAFHDVSDLIRFLRLSRRKREASGEKRR